MKKLSFILFALLTTQAWALDSKDAGTYQMLNMQGKPTPVYMRYYQKGEQWVMVWEIVGYKSHLCAMCSNGKNCYQMSFKINLWNALIILHLHFVVLLVIQKLVNIGGFP